jgi:ORF6N domain
MQPAPPGLPAESIEHLIFTVRGRRVILDADLARIYGVPTKRLLEQVRRNQDRFPSDFCFPLNRQEVGNLRSQIATSSRPHGGRRYAPWVFTEHGALMAANVLNSIRAIQMSIFIVRAFVKMRAALTGTRELARQLQDLEAKLTARLDTHETAIVKVLRSVMDLLNPPPEPEPTRPKIGFHRGGD